MFVTPLVYYPPADGQPASDRDPPSVIVGSRLLGIVGAFSTSPMVADDWAVYSALGRRAPAASGPAGFEHSQSGTRAASRSRFAWVSLYEAQTPTAK
jgi:hypothetical protein